MADCDLDNNSESLLPQESQDFFQESQDLFGDDSLLPPTNIIRDDPLQQESSQNISLTCEGYLKDDSSAGVYIVPRNCKFYPGTYKFYPKNAWFCDISLK